MQKKILFLALMGDPTLPSGIPNTGGFNQTLSELLKALAASEIPICIFTDTSLYCQERYTSISSNIELYRVLLTNEEHENQENLRLAQTRILSDIYSILGDDILNIALVHSFYWFSGHLAKKIFEQQKIPYVHTPISLAYYKIVAGYKANCPFQVECEHDFLQKANWILAITEKEAKVLCDYYKIDRSCIIVTGRSVDSIFHSPIRDYSGRPRSALLKTESFVKDSDAPWWVSGAFLYLGRMVPIKGILQIVQAWVLLRKKYGGYTPPLWLVGGNPNQIATLRFTLLQQVDSLSVYEARNEIVWWGYLDQVSISALLLKSLVLVTHSLFEAGGRVVLEAMCQGRAVLATPNGFAADYIKNWQNGFLIPYGNYTELARRMEHFIRQPYISYTMGNTAKSVFQQIEHIWNYTVIHENLYEQYLLGKEYLKNSCNLQNTNTPNELLEKVDCFPYFDIYFSDVEWKKQLSFCFPKPITQFNTIISTNAHARHYVVTVEGKRYRVKQFYNRLNRNSLWNSLDNKKVLRDTELFLKAEQSQHFSRIVPFIAASTSGIYFVLQELDLLIPNYKSLFDLLDAFSLSYTPKTNVELSKKINCQVSSIHYFPKEIDTLESVVDTLAKSTRELGDNRYSSLLNLLPQIKSILKQSYNDAKYGINYGKELSGHIVLFNGFPSLLPTSSWYLGEIGGDYINAALLTDMPICALPNQKTVTRQMLWLLVTSWKNMLIEEWSDKTSSRDWKSLVSYTLFELGLTNKKFIL